MYPTFTFTEGKPLKLEQVAFFWHWPGVSIAYFWNQPDVSMAICGISQSFCVKKRAQKIFKKFSQEGSPNL